MLIPTWLWWALLIGLASAMMLVIAVSIIKDAVENAVTRAMSGIENTVRCAVEDAMSSSDWNDESEWDGDEDD